LSAARRGAEASTVGVYRAELHKRALQWERTTGYLAPRKACGLLGLAVLALVLRADENAVHKDMVAFVERVGYGLAEAVEDHDGVSLGFGLPLVVRALPRLLRGDGQHGEIRAVAADLPLLGIFSEEADELDVIDLFLHFCPISLGHPRVEWILLPGRAAAFWEGPERFTGRNRESRRHEAAGRRNYPGAVPKERSGRRGKSFKQKSGLQGTPWRVR
jgi:hypothetical protein